MNRHCAGVAIIAAVETFTMKKKGPNRQLSA
jgi:hypothetical protein